MTARKLRRALNDLSDIEVCEIFESVEDAAAQEAFSAAIVFRLKKQTEKEREQPMTTEKKGKKRALAILLAAALLVLGAVGATAYGYFILPTKKLHDEMNFDVKNLSRVVDIEKAKDGDISIQNRVVKTDGYTVTFEAIVRADANREILVGEGWESADLASSYEEGLFAVVTVTRDDGGEILYGEDEKSLNAASIGASPLIHGVCPNMNTYFSVAGVYCEENVLYLLIDITDEAVWADRGLRLAVYGNYVFYPTWFSLDADGRPQFTDEAPKLHAMFELPLDPSYADADAQKTFMEMRPFEWATPQK